MWAGYAYDERRRLTQTGFNEGFTNRERWQYGLDRMGNVTKVTDVGDPYWTYEYDVRYRLTTARSYNSSEELLNSYAYTYDKAGNLVTKVLDDSTTTAFAHDRANEMTKRTVGGTVTDFAYDLWGSMTSKVQGQAYSASYGYRWGGKL
jgi:YD repeat-containing protein